MLARKTFIWIGLAVISCTLQQAFAYSPKRNYIEVHELHEQEIAPIVRDPPAPVDPAVNDFVTAPTIPLLPICVKQGYFRDPYNCAKFYFCEYTDAVPMAFYCQTGLIFDTITESCEEPRYVQC